jgi:hypothetical protein
MNGKFYIPLNILYYRNNMEKNSTKRNASAEESRTLQNLLRWSGREIRNAALVGAALVAGSLFIPTNTYSQEISMRNNLLDSSTAVVETSIPERSSVVYKPATNEEEALSKYNIKRSGKTEVLETANWAGYIVASDFNKPQPIIKAISGEWVIPAIRESKKEVEMVQWIGIGGGISGDKTLIQVGTTEHSKDGVNTYLAGIDMLPNDVLCIKNFPLKPGDVIAANITLIEGTAKKWNIHLINKTTNKEFSQDFEYDASRLTAEWMGVEAPRVNGNIATVPDFQNITMGKCYFEVDYAMLGLDSFPGRMMTANDGNGFVYTPTLVKDSTGFTIRRVPSSSNLQARR